MFILAGLRPIKALSSTHQCRTCVNTFSQVFYPCLLVINLEFVFCAICSTGPGLTLRGRGWVPQFNLLQETALGWSLLSHDVILENLGPQKVFWIALPWQEVKYRSFREVCWILALSPHCWFKCGGCKSLGQQTKQGQRTKYLLGFCQ